MKSNSDSELKGSLNTVSSVDSTGHFHSTIVRHPPVDKKCSSSQHPLRQVLCITAVSVLSVVLVVSALLLVLTVRRSMLALSSDADQTPAASTETTPLSLLPSQRRPKPPKIAADDVSRPNRRRAPVVDPLDHPRLHVVTSSPKPSVANNELHGASGKRFNVSVADGGSSLSDVISRQLFERGQAAVGDRSARQHLERRLAAELQRRRAELAERRRKTETGRRRGPVSNNSDSAGRRRQKNQELPSNELRRRARLTLRRHRQLQRGNERQQTSASPAAAAVR